MSSAEPYVFGKFTQTYVDAQSGFKIIDRSPHSLICDGTVRFECKLG